MRSIFKRTEEYIHSLSLKRKGLVLVFLPLLFHAATLLTLAYTLSEAKRAQQHALASRTVIAEASTLFRQVVHVLSSCRALLLTDNPYFLEQLDDLLNAARDRIERFSALPLGSERREDHAARMTVASLGVVEYGATISRLYKEGNTETAKQLIRNLEGENRLVQFESDLTVFAQEEVSADKDRVLYLEHLNNVAYASLLIGFALTVLTVTLIGALFYMGVVKRVDWITAGLERFGRGEALGPRMSGKDELAHIDRALHLMADSLEERMRENEMFIYSVSHDLRSPLVNLQGFGQELQVVLKELQELMKGAALQGEGLDRARALVTSDASESVHFIANGVSRLSAIIDGLLKLSRAGRLLYHGEKISVAETAKKVVDSLHKSLEDADFEVVVDPLPEVFGDRAALEQIIANIVDNAVKYRRPEGKKKLHIFDASDPGSPTMAVVGVRDNGIGIDEEGMKKLFLVFQRLAPERATGEGLGLALVRKVVGRLGGRVWAESKLGEGTTIYFSLPRDTYAAGGHLAARLGPYELPTA